MGSLRMVTRALHTSLTALHESVKIIVVVGYGFCSREAPELDVDAQ